MPIGTGIIYNVGDLILSQVSGSGTAFLETKIAAATSSLIYFDSTAKINSASLNSITVGTASYVSGSTSIITNLTASNISASGTGSFGMVGIGTTSPTQKLHIVGAVYGTTNGQFGNALITGTGTGFAVFGSNAGATGVKINLDSDITRNDLVISASTGYVGIGTASPGYTLEVNGTQRVVGNFYLFNTVVNPASNFSNQRGVGFEASTGKLEVAASGSDALAIGRFGSTGQILDFRYAGTQIGNFSLDTNDLTLATARHLILSPTGNVGIGTTSPAAKLHIYNGSSHFEATSNGNAAIVAGLYALQIGPLHDRDSTAERYYGGIAFNHLLNFGGGTTYNGAPQAWIGTRLQDTAGSERDYLVFATKPGTGTSGTGNDIPIERMCIDRDGLVGIGTTSPAVNLEVVGASETLGTIRISGGKVNVLAVGEINSALEFAQRDASVAGLVAGKIASISEFSNGAYAGLGFYTAQQSRVPELKEAVRITNNGDVGIGTTSPAYLLDVSGSSRHGYRTADTHQFTGSVSVSGSLNATASWATNALTASSLVVANSYTITNLTASNISASLTGSFGAVGIGTTTIVEKLTVNGNVRLENPGYIYIYGRNGSGNNGCLIYQNGTGQNAGFAEIATSTWGLGYWPTLPSAGPLTPYIQWSTSTETIKFRTVNADRVIIDSNGNVGIGTSSPAAKLEITGSSNSVLLNIKSPISGAILYVSGSGAVGIGTSNVGAYTLQVNGSFAATTKSFVIEHPTKAGKKLIYGSLESPYHGIRLTGRDTLVNGKSKIQLPDYIYKLILHDSVNIQLTGIKCNKTLYVDEINIPENYFTIAYDKAIFESYKDYDFFWDFTGIRADVPELTTEL